MPENTLPDAKSNTAAKPGDIGKAIEEVSGSLTEIKSTASNAVGALKALTDGDGNLAEVALSVKKAVDSITGLSGKISESLAMPLLVKMAAFKGSAILPAGKQMDPVLGIDVHMVILPVSPLPVPLPHPFVAILLSPKDWVSCMINTVKKTVLDMVPGGSADGKGILNTLAQNKGEIASIAMGLAGMGASVKFGNFVPRAVTGTKTKNFPHIPFGTGWHPAFAVPIAKNHGKVFLGSLFVVADGDPMAGCFHLNYDCWDIGIIDLFKFKRNAERKKPDPESPQLQLYVPSGTILPIPWNRPVLVNSVPTPINPLALLDKAFKAGLGKLKGALRKGAEKAIGKLPFSCASKTAVSKILGTGQSHPVDVAEGYFYTDNEDFSFPGPIPLSWERTWYSYSNYEGPLGHGWHHQYDMAIAYDMDNATAYLRMADGRGTELELPADTKHPTFNRKEKLQLHLHTEGYYFVKDTQGLIYRFTQKGMYLKGSSVQTHALQSISNANGFAIRFAYDEEGLLVQVTDSAGRIFTVTNDAAGRITAINSPHPFFRLGSLPIARYSYTEQGDLAAHTDALDQHMTFEYANHLMVKEVWRNGLTWHFLYNGNNSKAKCIEVWGDRNLLHYTFNYSNPDCTLVTNSLGHIKTFYHKAGLVTKYIDPNGAPWAYHYNIYNDLQWTTDPLGNLTGYTHDKWGNTLTTSEPDGLFTQTEYFNLHNPHLPTAATDARGGKWAWDYDGAGNLTKRTSPLKATTLFSYKDGLLVSIKDAIGAETLLNYGPQYNLQDITAPNGAITRYQYDVLGNCESTENPNGLRQLRAFDLLGRTTDINDFDGNRIQLSYDAIDNVVAYKDKLKAVTYTYSGLWKLRSRTEAGAAVYFNYDTEEQLKNIVNEQGLSYTFNLDPAGNVLKETGFDGLQKTYLRNPAGWVTRVNRPGKRFTQYSYDEAGRVTLLEYQDGSTETYKYHKGALQQATNNDAAISFERDVMGNVLTETCNGLQVSSTYDAIARRTNITSSMGAAIALELDMLDNITKIATHGWQANLQYDVLGLEVGRQLTGDIVSKIERDGIGRIRTHLVDDAIPNGRRRVKQYRQYIWGINDQLTRINDQSTGTTNFEHDKWGNLAKTTFSNGEAQLRNPNAVGNLFETVDRRDRKYDKGGKLLESKTAFYIYDEEGFLIEKKEKNGRIWKYEWNAAGMLQNVTRPDGSIVSFKYDALGRRIEKKYKKTITKFVWDGNKPLHEWKEFDFKETTPDDLITWIFEEDSFAPAAKIKGDKKYSLVCDHLGTPTQGYNEEGALIWERQLDSYGKIKMLQGDEGFCNYLYQGQTLDAETGLAYNRFRYYDAEEGVYISQDPIGLDGGMALYGYVNDTNGWVDALGLTPSGKLDSALGGTKGDNKQAQHLIPVKTWKDNEHFLNNTLGLSGQRDKATNGLLMHDNESAARLNGKAAFHNGSHKDYSNMVDARIKKIESDFNKHQNVPKAKAEITELQNRLKKALDRQFKGGCKRVH